MGPVHNYLEQLFQGLRPTCKKSTFLLLRLLILQTLIFLLFYVILESNLLNKHRFPILESDARNVKVLPFNAVCNC